MLAHLVVEETDAGPAALKHTPERLCLATRESKPATELLRFVVAPDGAIVPDIAGKLPGRGAWVTATREALEIALRNKAFARAFHGKGRATPELPDLVERLLERAAIEALSLANKAGRVITGFAKVQAALEAGKLAGLVHAREAARDGMNKLNGAVARATQAGKPTPIRVLGLAGEQLDLALGRPNVVHAGLLAHPASRGFLARWLRLQRWRTGSIGGDAVEFGRGAGNSSNLGSA